MTHDWFGFHQHIYLNNQLKEEIMTTATDEILYTNSWNGRSRAVEEALYDSTTQTFYVSLKSGAYAYHNVPESDWKDFVNSFSKGNAYNRIKKAHGPGTALDWDALDYAEERDEDDAAPETFTSSAATVTNVSNFTSQTVGTPKGLVYAENAKVDEPVEAKVFDLKAPEPVKTTAYNIVFEVNGLTKTVTLSAEGFGDAVSAVESVGEALGLEFAVKSVTLVG